MPRVFLSYTQADSALVTRAYADLTRARVGDVWCYEITSEYGADFRREYAQNVHSCDFFLLFDSRQARASPYVQEEVRICRNEARAKVLICLAEPPGIWREAELYPGLNRSVYFDFTDYESAIRDLCGHLGASYLPRFTIPRDVDFEQEIFAAPDKFPLEQRRAIIDKYDYFREVFGRDPRLAEAQLLLLIHQHLDRTDAVVISPYMALGALRNEAGRFREALDAFVRTSELAPADPRGWAGQGVANFGLARFLDAARCWEQSLECIAASDNQAHHQFKGEIRHNAASARLQAGDAGGAWRGIAPAVTGAPAQTEDLILAGRILLALGDDRATRMLSVAADRVATTEMIQSDLIVALVEALRQTPAKATIDAVLGRALGLYPIDPGILRQWAIQLTEAGDLNKAVAYYQRALKLDPRNRRMLAELALLCKHRGEEASWRELSQQCLDVDAIAPTDDYFVGLAHYLAGRIETARFHHQRCRQSPICSGWPFYDELVT